MNQEMNKLSVVIITYNAERKLEEVLKQVKKVSDDIILVDSGSSDRTLSIAQQYQTSIYTKDWLGYGTQKNFGNDQAVNDWILSIDSDEVLSDQLIQELKHLHLEEGKLYSIPFTNYYC